MLIVVPILLFVWVSGQVCVEVVTSQELLVWSLLAHVTRNGCWLQGPYFQLLKSKRSKRTARITITLLVVSSASIGMWYQGMRASLRRVHGLVLRMLPRPRNFKVGALCHWWRWACCASSPSSVVPFLVSKA